MDASCTGEYSGKFKMPGADGKMKDMNFKGISLDGYDNVKQKFVSTWIDNMGTGIMSPGWHLRRLHEDIHLHRRVRSHARDEKQSPRGDQSRPIRTT